ncbi:unnamed protein product [Notodromas monacha]|uniref:Uncharacterized protein n=1 Tax=Notodromas monacha TaxID=399045 RepID=A0A7R9G896_9CRUS|nr:unnamed protein product [Notodromas monacha]CAG0913044.1 unnamed protein product [Notodromas monacha]
MNEEVQNYPSQGKHKLKLGLIKRKPKRSSTSASIENGMTYSRSSADLTSPASVVDGPGFPGILTPPRTPSAPGSIHESNVDVPVPVCDHPHDWKEMSNVTVNIPISEIFDLMYVGSKYLVKFLEDRKTTDLCIGPMSTQRDGLRGRSSTFTVFRLAKMAIESLVWRQVGLFYGGMGPAVEEAARMSQAERDSWKSVVFPLEDSPGSPSASVAPSSNNTTSSTPTLGPVYHETPRVERVAAVTPAVMGTVTSLPVPYWWIMVLLLSLTWLNAFMVARLFTAPPDPVGSVVAPLGTAVAPFPHQHMVDRGVLSSYRRFADYQKDFRKSQVVYWKRVADMAEELLREAEMSLESLDEPGERAETPSQKAPVKEPPET